jgi:hypothetical protein
VAQTQTESYSEGHHRRFASCDPRSVMTDQFPFPLVELVYDDTCPNVALARTNLLAAFESAGLTATWSEHRVGDPNAPAHTRGYGSPTILVDRADVANTQAGAEACCRIYPMATEIGKAPSVELTAAALVKSANRRRLATRTAK